MTCKFIELLNKFSYVQSNLTECGTPDSDQLFMTPIFFSSVRSLKSLLIMVFERKLEDEGERVYPSYMLYSNPPQVQVK